MQRSSPAWFSYFIFPSSPVCSSTPLYPFLPHKWAPPPIWLVGWFVHSFIQRLEPDTFLTYTVFIMLLTSIFVIVHNSWTLTSGPFSAILQVIPHLICFSHPPFLPSLNILLAKYITYFVLFLLASGLFYLILDVNYHLGVVSLLVLYYLFILCTWRLSLSSKLETLLSRMNHFKSILNHPIKVWVNSL